MDRRSRPQGYAVRALALGLVLWAAAARAAPDPDLQIYLGFDWYEPDWVTRSWVLHDHSSNGFDVVMGNLGWDLALAPGISGQALQCSWAGIGVVETDGESIYEHGEGLTIAAWTRLTGPGFIRPIHVGSPTDNVIDSYITRDEREGADPDMWLGWSAYENDGQTRAFFGGVGVAVTDEWFHYAAVYDPANELALIYLDGEEALRMDAEGEPASQWGLGPTAVDIETSVHSTGDGLLFVDELRMYSRALTQAEIREVMRPPLAVSPGAGLATTWGALRQP